MFDTALVASNRRREMKRRLATLPAAVAVHALVLGFMIAGQLWAVSEVPEPFLPIIFVPPTAPPAHGTAGGTGDGHRRTARATVRQQVVQPEAVPSEPARSANAAAESDDPSDVPGGDPNGTDTGIPGGVSPDDRATSVPGEPPQASPIVLSPDMLAPVPLARTMPAYPELARKARKEGVVIVQAVIDRDGNVVGADILRDIGFGCGEAAVEAIRGWRYRPALLDGRPVSVYLTVTVVFRLTGVE